jgi:protein SFI1
LEQRDTHLLASAIGRWVSSTRRTADKRALADSFVIVKGEETVRAVLGLWRDRAARKRELRHAEIEAEQKKRGELLRFAWETWRGNVLENRLAPIVSRDSCDSDSSQLLMTQEEEVVMRHEDAILFMVWDKWKARATVSINLSPKEADH